ncbi:hypothetical protein [uncultured Methanomethylovorans sp.]|uniref:hypothetical protein n=1 Tax=uncultured Methanomethylovorans sp. TaxID=183759 RepID=UPI002AA8E910|nr:hypothetical protein [uncultured Methanomethylovorans sp.]
MESLLNPIDGFKECTSESKISRFFGRNHLKGDKVFDLILFLFILYGLALKFRFALAIPLNSDSVLAGLVSREVLEHGNYFLSGYYFPSADPYIFSDFLPFHLLPQLFSDYDPMALVVSSYLIFIGTVVVYSMLIYSITKNITNSLIFSALIANVPNSPFGWGSYSFFAVPTGHTATILFIGLLLLICEQDARKEIKSILYLLILILISFSDSILILWYLVPFFVTQTFLNRPFELRKIIFPFISMASVGLIYLLKESVNTFVSIPVSLITSKAQILDNWRLFYEGIALLYNFNLYQFTQTHRLDIQIAILIPITIGIIYFIVVNISYNMLKKPVCLFPLLSIAFTSIVYIFTSVSIDILTTRYLTFPLIICTVILALIYNKNTKHYRLYSVLFLLLVIINAGSNLEAFKSGYQEPNQEQYELISYLKESNLTYGYADYWDSNIITYLSKEEVIIRPVTFTDTGIVPFRWLSCERWFEEQGNITDKVFILQRNMQKGEIEAIVNVNPPKETLEFGNYKIYVWNTQELQSLIHFS